MLLVGAQIRQLSGGTSKQDTKQGFAIIESSGTIRYFVASSASDYALWTREITAVIGRSEHKGINDESGFLASGELSTSEIEAPQTSERRIQLGKKLSGVGQATKNRIGSALQSARQKGTDMSSARKLKSMDGFDMESSERSGGVPATKDDSVDGFNYDIADNDQSTPEGFQSALPPDTVPFTDGLDSETDATGSIDDDSESANTRRRFGSRIGSAIQNVRQNRKETPENHQQRPLGGLRGKLKGISAGRGNSVESEDENNGEQVSSEFSSLHELAPDGDYTWTCAVCTFINNSENHPIQHTICDMCGSERSLKARDATQDLETAPNIAVSSSIREPLAQIPEKIEEDSNGIGKVSESESEGTQMRRGRFRGLGDAVTRISFRKGALALTGEAAGAAIALKNIHASGKAPHVSVSKSDPVPLKKFETQWVVSVKATRVSVEDKPTPEVIPEESSQDDQSIKDPSESSNQEGKTEERTTRGDDDVANAINDMKANSSLDAKMAIGDSRGNKAFLVEVYGAGEQMMKPCIDMTLRLGDLLQLYTEVLESVERIMPQLVEGQFEGDSSTSREHLKEGALKAFEKVTVAGRILGGLLELDENSDLIEKTHTYQGEFSLSKQSWSAARTFLTL